jgi:energy-coupling factor transporter ATP-binding protein EcfA2
MSTFQQIQSALIAINDSIFQELCDHIIFTNREPTGFTRTGSQVGKQKTVKGTPDSFFINNKKNFVFIEYSTNITEGYKKLYQDVEKCFLFEKTKINVDQIDELILCFNFNLKPEESEKLLELGIKNKVLITLMSLDQLSLDISINYRIVASRYLEIPIDSGQVISIDDFIKEYNKAGNSIATPLNNPFLSRENETRELLKILDENNFVIVTGPPGVGKTRLSLETIGLFCKDKQKVKAKCISYKFHSLFDDLSHAIKENEEIILFVDDANRIDSLNDIFHFYTKSQTGKLKVVLTLRDYAFKEFTEKWRLDSYATLDLKKLDDEVIKTMIQSAPFNFNNPENIIFITNISDGNPRIALMCAKLFDQKPLVHIKDLNDLFENYFSNFTFDALGSKTPIGLKCLGLISFFYAMPYKERDLVESILTDFGIKYDEFIDQIELFNRLEIVDIQFDNVKISEQNLATYCFYKAFVKDELLDFEILLQKYFSSHKNRFKDCIIPTNNTYGQDLLEVKIVPCIKRFYAKQVDKQVKYNILSLFWYFLQLEVFEYAQYKISCSANPTDPVYDFHKKNNDFFNLDDNPLNFLKEFFRYNVPNLKIALELSCEYVLLHPEESASFLKELSENLKIEADETTLRKLNRQLILLEVLSEGMDKNFEFASGLYFEISKVFLKTNYTSARAIGRGKIQFIEINLYDSQGYSQLRNIIWTKIKEIAPLNKKELESFLKSYYFTITQAPKTIIQKEYKIVLEVVNSCLDPNSFINCELVQTLMQYLTKKIGLDDDIKSTEERFINSALILEEKLNWQRVGKRDAYDFKNYREFEELKEKQIRHDFTFRSIQEIDSFYNDFKIIATAVNENWNYLNALQIISDQNFKKDWDFGFYILSLICDDQNEIGFIPSQSFRNILVTDEHCLQIWNLIESKSFKHKTSWKLSYFDNISDDLFSEKHIPEIIKTIDEIDFRTTLHLDRLSRFSKYDNLLFKKILSIVHLKNLDPGNQILLWMDFISDFFELISGDIELVKKVYLQQYRYNNHFDFEHKGFIKILEKDRDFLIEYLEDYYINSKTVFGHHSENLGFVWNLKDMDELVEKALLLIIEKDYYIGFGDHYSNSFFKQIPEDKKTVAKTFLLSFAAKHNENHKAINIIIDIARHTMTDCYNEILLQHLKINKSVDLFKMLSWNGNGGTYSGDVIIAEVEAAQWKDIQEIIEKGRFNLEILPIRKYIQNQIDHCMERGKEERKRNFLSDR